MNLRIGRVSLLIGTAAIFVVGGAYLGSGLAGRSVVGKYEKFHGVWTLAFESSEYQPLDRPGPGSGKTIWLKVDEALSQLILSVLKVKRVGGDGCKFEVRFSGNAITGSAGFGHFGLADSQIDFRRIESIRLINGADAPRVRRLEVTENDVFATVPHEATTCP